MLPLVPVPSGHGLLVEDGRLVASDRDAWSGWFGGFGRSFEELELLPGDGDIAHDLPSQATVWSGTSDLDAFGAQ